MRRFEATITYAERDDAGAAGTVIDAATLGGILHYLEEEWLTDMRSGAVRVTLRTAPDVHVW
jgi:hypothetical protein